MGKPIQKTDNSNALWMKLIISFSMNITKTSAGRGSPCFFLRTVCRIGESLKTNPKVWSFRRIRVLTA